MPDLSQCNSAYNQAVPHGIQGLYSSLSAAATILRIARAMGELDVSVALPILGDDNTRTGDEILQDFFQRLDEIERELSRPVPQSRQPPCYHVGHTSKPRIHSYIAVVEGLDGSGKSSLVDNLVAALNEEGTAGSVPGQRVIAKAMATPSQSLTSIRPVFDKRGGPVARAFYAVSNYILQHEIQQLQNELASFTSNCQDDDGNVILILVVDRWYTSTVAYSVAWKNTEGGEESINQLDSSIFAWPTDLRQPDILFLLQVDDQTRRDRVNRRNNTKESTESLTQNKFNPWDQRLDQDEQLGRRIMRSFERVAEGLPTNATATTTIRLDAQQSKEQVLTDAMEAVRGSILDLPCHGIRDPLETFESDPMGFFTWVCSELNLCHPKTGRRLKHAPWAMQLAWEIDKGDTQADTVAPPVLKTVGIHTADASGIVCFMRNSFPNDNRTISASMVWVGGNYPYEQQWRAEGFLQCMSAQECQVLDCHPPPSLIAYTVACHDLEQEPRPDPEDVAVAAIQETLVEKATEYRKDLSSVKDKQKETLHGVRFVLMRMEILAGGPSSPGGPYRYEWSREWHHEWTKARSIPPFRGTSLIKQFPAYLKPITVAITGTHCAGKATIGRILSKNCDVWSPFDAELGCLLRNQVDLTASGHRIGDGGGKRNAIEWDDLVYESEMKRDEQCKAGGHGRVVETWHVGNLAWAMLRAEARGASDEEKARLILRAEEAVQKHLEDRVVIFVHLTISPQDSVRRRHIDNQNVARLPMVNETLECNELHEYLDVRTREYLEILKSKFGLPVLVVDNSKDYDMHDTLQQVVNFVQSQQWRRASACR
jgi:thymidylate kinase